MIGPVASQYVAAQRYLSGMEKFDAGIEGAGQLGGLAQLMSRSTVEIADRDQDAPNVASGCHSPRLTGPIRRRIVLIAYCPARRDCGNLL